jgi:hypothetical protein
MDFFVHILIVDIVVVFYASVRRRSENEHRSASEKAAGLKECRKGSKKIGKRKIDEVESF